MTQHHMICLMIEQERGIEIERAGEAEWNRPAWNVRSRLGERGETSKAERDTDDNRKSTEKWNLGRFAGTGWIARTR